MIYDYLLFIVITITIIIIIIIIVILIRRLVMSLGSLGDVVHAHQWSVLHVQEGLACSNRPGCQPGSITLQSLF